MMPWLQWLPWKFIIRYIARAHGFLDPIALLAHLHRFAQPSEVDEPIELLRAGVVFHARGLINSRVIQHNLDWVWPYWVERQFDPRNASFVPRAFSITHINLTHRNWTAIGWPDLDELPIVGPRGLLTPFLDEWSLDGWIVTEAGQVLLPSRAKSCTQRLMLDKHPAVITETNENNLYLETQAEVLLEAEKSGRSVPVCRMGIKARADTAAWMVVALRPYNPEGISFIHKVKLTPDHTGWEIDGKRLVRFNMPADHHHVSTYHGGDVYLHLLDLENNEHGKCDIGMATAAALFRLDPLKSKKIEVSVPLHSAKAEKRLQPEAWRESMQGRCVLGIPDKRFQFLYDAALRTLILHSPGDVYPGPYTYKRFWFRDAAFIIHALLYAGFTERAERALDRFPDRQSTMGYFRSQEGEWDSNGEALWIMRRFCELTGQIPKKSWRDAVRHGGRWIYKKRLVEEQHARHAGLLPAGFSAEHLGPNDFYYWDDFWGVAGLKAASYLAESFGDRKSADRFEQEARLFATALDHSIKKVSARLGRPAIPASPYRRLDAGAIGSLAAGYPLQLWEQDDPRLLDTAEFLINNCMVHDGFFQDMIHSGINAYLTLHIAQVLLRAADPRYFTFITSVAELASPTGQWPEAIHPRTLGGCMGDGQHVWAAAEWILMLRNCFVREEEDRLLLATGIPAPWLDGPESLSFGPAPTTFGTISLAIESRRKKGEEVIVISWQADWHGKPPAIEVRLPGFNPVMAEPEQKELIISRL